MASFANAMRRALAGYIGFLQIPLQRHPYSHIIALGRLIDYRYRSVASVCQRRESKNRNKPTFSNACNRNPHQGEPAAKGKKVSDKQTKAYDISYESYWDESKILEIESKRPELFIRGTVVIPAFATSEARIVQAVTDDAFVEASGEASAPEAADFTGNIKESSKTWRSTSVSRDGIEIENGSDSSAGATVHNEVKQRGHGNQTGKSIKPVDEKGVPIFGFLSRNRAFHGDEVVGFRQRRSRELTTDTDPPEAISEQCRVVSIIKRSQALCSFVGVLEVDSYLGPAEALKCQPQDTRWPAFNVKKSSISSEIAKKIECVGRGGKVLCLMRFDEWQETHVEPKGTILRVIGDITDSDSQMEASMIFHGLNPNGFSSAVMNELKDLIAEAAKKEENRTDLRNKFVFTIDPQDAKDLDDALSVEILKYGSGKYKYRIGVHIADVSHYVRGGSLVDLDARQRATSVYLEHRVFPMLPHPLSEDLCSLLPDSEKLCFSMVADLVEESSDGEMIGSNLYLTNHSFLLSRIISRKRLSYNAAKEIIYGSMGNQVREVEGKLESMSFSDFQKDIIEPLYLSGGKQVSDISKDENVQNNEGNECKEGIALNKGHVEEKQTEDVQLATALMVLYYISRKLRHFRLKQRGAVTVDTSGNQKCHIPRVGENTTKFWVEQIPKESHELVEEMMLLANTQAAQLLSKSFDKYFLRVHENTSKAIKQLVGSRIPQELRKIINPEILPIPELLRKCAKHMEPTAFQSLSFAALQQFKEAVYSPVDKMDSNRMAISGHWGLALPMYLHFTSPIRRYSDLYTHRMLKTIIDGSYTEQSLKVLDEICKQCNLQKRKAFDVQKDYKNFSFNQYLRWACISEDGTEPYAANDPLFAKCLTKANSDTWGMIYEDACVFTIVINDQKCKDPGNKSSIIFYIPMLAEQRSVSCDSLNVVPLEAIVDGEKVKLDSTQQSSNAEQIMDGYRKEVKKCSENSNEAPAVQSIMVRIGNEQRTLSQYQRVKVVLIPGSQMWTLRLPLGCELSSKC